MGTDQFWRVMAIAILAGAAAGVTVGTAISKVGTANGQSTVVQAQRFELVNTRGKVIATWASDGDRAAIAFLDDAGHARAELGISLKRPSERLMFWDADHRIRIGLTTDANGKPALNMGDEARESRLLLGYLDGQSAAAPSALGSSDAWGLVLPKTGALSSWAGVGVMTDPTTRLRAGRVSVTDSKGKIWRLP